MLFLGHYPFGGGGYRIHFPFTLGNGSGACLGYFIDNELKMLLIEFSNAIHQLYNQYCPKLWDFENAIFCCVSCLQQWRV